VAPRAEGREADPRLAAEPPLDVGHERRTLLVARLEEMDIGVEQRVEQRERLLPGHAEGPVDALVLEAADEQLRRGHPPSPMAQPAGVCDRGR